MGGCMPETPPTWVVEHLDDIVDAEFDNLPLDIQAKFLHLAALVEELGLLTLREPYVKHLRDKLWELRVKTKSSYGRGLYCTVKGRRVVVLRYFVKTSPKTPPQEVDIAVERMRTCLANRKEE
jgi:phage-related protein